MPARARGSSRKKLLCFSSIALGLALSTHLQAQGIKAFEIAIDHKTKAQSVNGLAEIAPGETVVIRISNTDVNCFTYNASQVKGNPAIAAAGGAPPPVVIETTHQRSITSYVVKVEKIAKAPAACDPSYKDLGESYTWTIPVTTVGWDLYFSGGPVIDGLTDKKYFLRSDGNNQFTVLRDSNAQDRTNQRLGVFAHLVNTQWTRDSGRGWVPISFGLGFDDKARYMLGTSYRFGEQWFVTAGAVSGKTATLPVGVSEGMSTTNQNLLATLGQRSAASWFISVSFNFLGAKAKSAFEGQFQAPKPNETAGVETKK